MLGRGLRVRATLVARAGQHQIWRGRGAFACFSTSIQAASSSEKHIAVVGGGAAGLYTASRLLAKAQDIRIDVFEQLPTPYGLVRFGVAPDHPEVKNCTTKFAQVCDDSRVRLFGNIKIGNGPLLSLERLLSVYDGVVLSYGASEDRKLGIPGEDRAGVVSAREFVAWYNGLPEAQELNPDLESSDRVVIVGQGNVGLDCARILLTDPEDLAKTDITARALDRLRRSKVRHVEMVGRRGPLQVAFTTKELREMTKIPGVAFICDRELVARECERWAGQVEKNRSLKRMMDLLLKHATGDPVGVAAGKERSFTLRFLRSPVEVEGGPERGAALGVRFRVNRLEEGAGEAARAVGTDEFVTVPCGMMLRSIGYASTAVDATAPFDRQRGIVPNIGGRVTDGHGQVVPGLYVAGWVKRGPVGVIATTMQDAYHTGDAILADIHNGYIIGNSDKTRAINEMLARAGVLDKCVTNAEWKRLEAFEVEAGRAAGKPREKVTGVAQMLDIVRK